MGGSRLERSKVLRVGFILVAAIIIGPILPPVGAHAQQSASLPDTLDYRPRPAEQAKAAISSKTELASRFRQIKEQYAEIKTAAEKFVPLTPDASDELKVTRLKIEAAMRSYDYYEFQTQQQRDQLNRLVRLNEVESMRLQHAMERLAKMSATISNLMKRINETGDALVVSQ